MSPGSASKSCRSGRFFSCFFMINMIKYYYLIQFCFAFRAHRQHFKAKRERNMKRIEVVAMRAVYWTHSVL